MARFLASLFEDTLGVVFEDFTKDQVSSSLFRGKFSATNLCIRREFLNEIIYPLCADSASCNSVEIDLPVGSLESMPLRITVGRVFMNLSCSPHSSPPSSNFMKKLSNGDSEQKRDKKDQKDKDKEKGSWSKAIRILCGILLEIDLIEIRVNIGTLSLRLCLRDLVLQSTSADWSPVARSGLLAQCFDDSSVPGQVKFFKVLQTNSLQLQILSLDTGHCSTIVDVAFKANIGISLLKENLRPTELHFDANLSRFTVSLNNQQVERLYVAAFDLGRLFRSVIVKHLSGSDALAPLATNSGDEALLRMKTLFQWREPTVEEGQSYENFFREEGGVKNLTHNFRKYPKSFTGISFVEWLVTPNPKATLVVGQLAAEPGHTSCTKVNGDSWTLAELSRIEQAFRGCDKGFIKDRRFRLKNYANTFLGSDLCTWLCSDDTACGFNVGSRAEAVTCGRAMLHHRIAHHVVDEHDFEDSDKYFFRFCSDEVDKAPSKSVVDAPSSVNPRVTAFATSRQHATFIGHCLLKSQRLKQVDNEPNFLDESILYQFASDVQGDQNQKEQVLSSATDASPSIAFPHVKISFSLCETKVIIGSSTPSATPILSKTSEALPGEQKLADASAFKGNAAGHLERRSDIIKSWERRFVVVRDGDVAIFDNEEDAMTGKQPRKFYLLRECEVRPSPLPGHPHAFEVVLTAPKKVLVFSTILAASGNVGCEARDYWIQAFRYSGSQASSGTRVVAVEDNFIEVSSIHHQAWQVALVADPVTIPCEIQCDRNWTLDCKSLSISLQLQDVSGNKRSMLSIEGLSLSANSNVATSTISINLLIENVRVLLLLQAYLKYIHFLLPARFWCETLLLPVPSLLEMFRGPPEIPSPLLTFNFKVLINAPFYVQLPLSPIDAPVEKSLLLNFLLKVNVKSGILSLDQLRALDVYISLVNLCASITSLNEATLLQELPRIKSCSGSDEILSVLVQTDSAILLLIPVIDFHVRVPLRALEGVVSPEVRGEPWTAALSPSALLVKRKMEMKCDIKQNSIFLLSPDMIAAAILTFKPMLLIAREQSVFGTFASVQKLFSRVSAAQQQTSDDSSLVFHESPFANLAEAKLTLSISHVSAVIQTSAHKSLLMRVTGINVQVSQEPRLEFVIKQIIASVSSHPPSELGIRGGDFVSSRILYNESKGGEPAVSLVLETKKAAKKINKNHFSELQLAEMVKWHDAQSHELFREDASDFDQPHFSLTLIGSINGLMMSLNMDELLSVNYTNALLNDLISAFKLVETDDFIITELFSIEVAESSDYFQFANRLDSHDLLLRPQADVTEDGLSRIFDAFKISRNAKCFFGCSIGMLETSSHLEFNTSRGIERIDLSVPSVLVQLIASFSLRAGAKTVSSVPLVMNAIQEDKALAAMLSAIYGRTPNLHLVVAAQLSAFQVNAGPYGLVDPMPVICDMRNARVSWSTVLLSPTSWDSRSGVRSCIGEFKFCPIPEFAMTMLAFQNLVQANTRSLMNRLQIMEQKTALFNASVKDGRRLSLQPECLLPPAEEIASADTRDSSEAQSLVEGSAVAGASSQTAAGSVVASAVNSGDLPALLAQFDQCKQELAFATSKVLLLQSSTEPLTLKQKLMLKKDEEALPALQTAFDTSISHLFNQMRAFVAEKNDSLAAAESYRRELHSMQAARDVALRDLEKFRQLSGNDAGNEAPKRDASSDDSKHPPAMWMADEDAPSCCICDKRFSLFVRRHHCRICLRVICSSCCTKAVLPPQGVRKALCCVECAR